MKDKILKAADIAGIAGITEEEVKRISKEFSRMVPSRNIGKVKVYEEKAAGVISNISELTKKGLSADEIMNKAGVSGIKKSTKDKVSQKIRRNPVSAGKKRGVKSASSIPSPASKTADATESRVEKIVKNSTKDPSQDNLANLDLKLSRITARVEKLETEISEHKMRSAEELKELRAISASLEAKIECSSEWISYFEKTLDDYSESQDKINKSFQEWTDYTDQEIENLKLPWWRRKK